MTNTTRLQLGRPQVRRHQRLERQQLEKRRRRGARAARGGPASRRGAFRTLRHHGPARATAQQGPDRRLGTGDGADRAPPRGPRARSRRRRLRGSRAPLHRASQERRGHPPDRRGERPPARARHGDRRAHGDTHRCSVSRVGQHRRAVARCAHSPACRGAAGRLRPCRPRKASSPRRAGRNRAARSRRLRHLRRRISPGSSRRAGSRSGPTWPASSAPIRARSRGRGCSSASTTRKRRRSRRRRQVLHPRCLSPLREARVPLWSRTPTGPTWPARGRRLRGRRAAQLKAIAHRSGITLVSMESVGMWHQVGFLADVFEAFSATGSRSI